jgi:hypothetical protein
VELLVGIIIGMGGALVLVTIIGTITSSRLEAELDKFDEIA